MRQAEGVMMRSSIFATVAVFIVGSIAIAMPSVGALPAARSYTNNETGDVFLGGEYIELGLSKLGSFGTTYDEENDENTPPLPNGFFGTAARDAIGMSTNPTGFGVAPDLRMDFFMPGSPEERWVVGYKESGSPVKASNAFLSGSDDIEDNVVTDQSSGSTLQAMSLGTHNDKLETKQVISFDKSEKFFKNEVTLKNVSGSSLDSVRYMRSFDPDNTVDQSGDFDTRNKIPYTHEAGDGVAAVVADTSLNADDPVFAANGSRSPIMFYSSDERARVSTFGFDNDDPFEAEAYDEALPKGTSVDEDQAITIAFDVGSLSAGSSQTFTYYTSLDNRDFDTVLGDIVKQEAGPNNGDGNGDGIQDSEQPHVRSVVNSVVGGTGKYVTIESTGCGTVSSLGLQGLKHYGTDDKYEYPLGLVDFEAMCTNPGDTTTIKLYYDQKYDSSRWYARKFINNKFIPVPGAVFGIATVGSQQVTTLTYQVTDGGSLDADSTANGMIVDPAGPAVLPAATAPNTGLAKHPITLALIAVVIGIGLITRNVYKHRTRNTL